MERSLANGYMPADEARIHACWEDPALAVKARRSARSQVPDRDGRPHRKIISKICRLKPFTGSDIA
jgi:hypothetical protein